MKVIKTLDEYEQMKKNFNNDIDSFLKKFDIFLNSTSPSYWRTTGKLYTDMKNFKKEVNKFEPLNMKHLEIDWVRDEVLDDEDREEWNNIKKYNL